MSAPFVRRDHSGCREPHDPICYEHPFTGADLTPTEAATVARFDAAPDAEESLRERVARAICRVDYPFGFDDGFRLWADSYRDRADAAIRAMRGDDA